MPQLGDLLPLSDERLQDKRFVFLCDSQDIESVCEALGINAEHVSGMLAHAADGDYIEVWTTGYQRSYALDSRYECVCFNGRTAPDA